ncbi:MAG: patatin-like phospholipase family protein [Pseudomonadota bacterium]
MAVKKKKVNLALQGGGAHGAFTWGVLERLITDGRLDIVGISGTSAGAINAALLADGYVKNGPEGACEAMETFWLKMSKLGTFSVIQRTPFDRWMGNWTLDFSPGRMMFDSFVKAFSPYEFNPLGVNPLLDLIKETINFDRVQECNAFKLFMCATNVRTGKNKIFSDGEICADAVMASACLPEIYQAVEIDGEHYWDGGFMGNPPLYPLFYQTGCNDILLVQINPIERQELPKSARDINNRMNEITFNATLMRELRIVEFVSRLIDGGKLDKNEYMRVKMHKIGAAPEMRELSASSKLNLEMEFLLYLREVGRNTADSWLDENFDKIGKVSTLDLKSFFN